MPKFHEVDPIEYCGKCRKQIKPKEETESLGMALDFELKWHR